MKEIPTLTEDEREEARKRLIGKEEKYVAGADLIINKISNGYYCDFIKSGLGKEKKRRGGTEVKIFYEIKQNHGVILKDKIKYSPTFTKFEGGEEGGERYRAPPEILEILQTTEKPKLLGRCLDHVLFNTRWAYFPSQYRGIGEFKTYIEDLEEILGKKLAKRIIETEKKDLRKIYTKIKNEIKEKLNNEERWVKNYGII